MGYNSFTQSRRSYRSIKFLKIKISKGYLNLLNMESTKLCFFTIMAFVSVFQTVRAIECYKCKFGTTCPPWESMQDKMTCPSGWENCQTVTTQNENNTVVSVEGGCV